MKPKKAFILLKFEIDMEGWDDDVDWTDPEDVFMEQFDSVGFRELVGNDNYDEPEVLAIEFKPSNKKKKFK